MVSALFGVVSLFTRRGGRMLEKKCEGRFRGSKLLEAMVRRRANNNVAISNLRRGKSA